MVDIYHRSYFLIGGMLLLPYSMIVSLRLVGLWRPFPHNADEWRFGLGVAYWFFTAVMFLWVVLILFQVEEIRRRLIDWL